MHTENHIDIAGLAERVFALAADTAAWPRWLPHYRFVRQHGRVAHMGALRNRFPVSWWAIQESYPDEGRITFRHVGGITRGMEVEWRITPTPGGAHVVIAHDLAYPAPVLGWMFARYIVGGIFVTYIADRTLRRLKQKVESER
ncbi:MAG TPA: SRPBCC family protein [Armatimonadota bacterium]|jgi:ribosome-associated toxin RatA of RatAB toxin-antitoxin module